MEEKKSGDHSKAITFVSDSSPAIEQIEMSSIQDITTKKIARKNKVKTWISSSQNDTTTCCCCNIPSKAAKCLELSGLITGIVIVLMLFSIPIISYFVQVSEKYTTNILPLIGLCIFYCICRK